MQVSFRALQDCLLETVFCGIMRRSRADNPASHPAASQCTPTGTAAVCCRAAGTCIGSRRKAACARELLSVQGTRCPPRWIYGESRRIALHSTSRHPAEAVGHQLSTATSLATCRRAPVRWCATGESALVRLDEACGMTPVQAREGASERTMGRSAVRDCELHCYFCHHSRPLPAEPIPHLRHQILHRGVFHSMKSSLKILRYRRSSAKDCEELRTSGSKSTITLTRHFRPEQDFRKKSSENLLPVGRSVHPDTVTPHSSVSAPQGPARRCGSARTGSLIP